MLRSLLARDGVAVFTGVSIRSRVFARLDPRQRNLRVDAAHSRVPRVQDETRLQSDFRFSEKTWRVLELLT